MVYPPGVTYQLTRRVAQLQWADQREAHVKDPNNAMHNGGNDDEKNRFLFVLLVGFSPGGSIGTYDYKGWIKFGGANKHHANCDSGYVIRIVGVLAKTPGATNLYYPGFPSWKGVKWLSSAKGTQRPRSPVDMGNSR